MNIKIILIFNIFFLLPLYGSELTNVSSNKGPLPDLELEIKFEKLLVLANIISFLKKTTSIMSEMCLIKIDYSCNTFSAQKAKNDLKNLKKQIPEFCFLDSDYSKSMSLSSRLIPVPPPMDLPTKRPPFPFFLASTSFFNNFF